MKKYWPIGAYGLIIMIAGAFLAFSPPFNFMFTRYFLGVLLSLGAVLSFMASRLRSHQNVPKAYHQLHAGAMLFGAVYLIFFCQTREALISALSFLLFFYSVSELIFCSWLFNLNQRMVFRTMATRAILAFIVGLGTVVALGSKEFVFEIFGGLFISVGILVIMYNPTLKSDRMDQSLRYERM